MNNAEKIAYLKQVLANLETAGCTLAELSVVKLVSDVDHNEVQEEYGVAPAEFVVPLVEQGAGSIECDELLEVLMTLYSN